MNLYRIEFYPINSTSGALGYDLVEQDVAGVDLRQIMANWYVNIETQYFQNFEEFEQEDVDWCLQGVFIVRDRHYEIIHRVTSEMVKFSTEIETADPVWFQKKSSGASTSESSRDPHEIFLMDDQIK